jgi:excisionase family DNA binding protein
MAALTVKQVSERMGVSPGTVYGLCSSRRLRHTRIGRGRGAIRISEEAVAEYLATAEVAPVGAPPPPAAATRKVRLNHLSLS